MYFKTMNYCVSGKFFFDAFKKTFMDRKEKSFVNEWHQNKIKIPAKHGKKGKLKF